MNIKEKVIVIASVITCLQLQAQGADKFTDGNRPYEFGFSIEGEQHRHEKKDEKGLIEGEFGFITADGVYHVTVYATDEQGRFKILSMKNIRVKPYPTYTASSISARQGHSLGHPAAASTQSSLLPPVITTTFKSISIEPPAKSCSHCSIPTTSTVAPVIPPFKQPSGSTNNVENSGNLKIWQRDQLKPTFVDQPIRTAQTPQRSYDNSAPQSVVPNYSKQSQTNLAGEQVLSKENLVPPQNSQNLPQQGFGPAQSPSIGLTSSQENLQDPGINYLQSSRPPTYPQQELQTPLISPIKRQNSFPGSLMSEYSPRDGLSPGNAPSDRTPKSLGDVPSINLAGAQPNYLQTGEPNDQVAPALPIKPTLISAQMKIVDKNTDIYHRSPGENEGLPEGLTKDDMSKLLYTFNYTVGFHGHFEEGYQSGAKQGYYFVTGRNGVRTRVDYIADSKGFRPKISQEVLDLLSDDVPKAETEKEEKYGLKGYEFKWLYYPVEANRG